MFEIAGFRCSLYKMKLVEDDIYISVMLNNFWLPEEAANAVNIPGVVEGLLFVKVRLLLQKPVQL